MLKRRLARLVGWLPVATAFVALGCSFDPSGAQAGSVGQGEGSTGGSVDVGATDPTSTTTTTGADGDGDDGTDTLPDLTTGVLPGGEDCLNGIDDNDDGLVDCEDPVCMPDHGCFDAPPDGWTGFFEVALTPVAMAGAPMPCANGLPAARRWEGPQAGQCEACTCGALANALCGITPLFCDPGASSCGDLDDWTSFFAGTLTCERPGGAGASTSMSCQLGTTPVNDPGGCPPAGGAPMNPPDFAQAADICGGPVAGSGCQAGQICAPKKLFEAPQICVFNSGDLTCPAGWDQNPPMLLHEGSDDQRDCDACTCAPSTTCTQSTYRFYDFNNCGGGGINVSSSNCQPVGAALDNDTWSVRRNTDPTPQGSCTPAGGQPIGAVIPSGTGTFCCQ